MEIVMRCIGIALLCLLSWGWSIDSTSLVNKIVVDSLEFELLDPFDDVTKYSKTEAAFYSFMNTIHITTKESVVRKNLLFAKGDTISPMLLLESERLLRNRVFISDASITPRTGENGASILRVKTSDHWTLIVPFALSNPSGESWEFLAGILENNFLGLGHTLGFYYQHTIDRDLWFGEYGTSHFIWPHHTLAFKAGKTTDGSFVSGLFQHPFLSREKNQWAYTIAGAKNIFGGMVFESPLDTLAREPLSPAQVQALASVADTAKIPQYSIRKLHAFAQFDSVAVDTLSVRINRSFGKAIKAYVRAGYEYEKRRQLGASIYPIYKQAGGNGFYRANPSVFTETWQRLDSRIALGITLNHYSYLKVKNYRHIKWTEDVNLGWQFANFIKKNFEELGADNSDLLLEHSAYFSWAFSEKSIVSATATTEYRLAGDSLHDQYSVLSGEYQFKPLPIISTVFKGSLAYYNNTPETKLLYMGGDAGMNGMPYYYYGGTARYLFEVEQRWFSGFEVGTVVPVFTAYLNAGEVYDSPDELDLETLHYIAGLGVRLGMSKSTQGVINCLNVGWPLNGPLEDGIRGVRFSVFAKVQL
jgi:hypothetical protein